MKKCTKISINEEKLKRYLEGKCLSANCSLCEQGIYTYGTEVLALISIDKDNLGPGDTFMPLIAFTCQYCGHAVFVNPLIAGILDLDEDMRPYANA